MFDVITLGSATLDVFLRSSKFQLSNKNGAVMLCETFGEKIDVEQAAVSTGGAASNTAVGFARMGFATACVTETGTDFAGEIVLHDLKTEGVDASLLLAIPTEQTAVSALLISEDGARTALVFRGASRNMTAAMIDWSKIQAKRLHLASIGNAELVIKTLEHCKQQGIKVSWNPGNWEIEQIRSGALKPDWSAVDILCLNRGEMANMSGMELGRDEAWTDAWSFPGPRVVIVTDGKKGGQYLIDGVKKSYIIEDIPTVQETGAGDAFICGVVSGQLLGETLEDSIGRGKKNAASVVQQMGAKKGLMRKQ
ncbi:MAG TPA: carbohydrate kinase family protein [Candidatus Saccharimonadia bacterium]|nr:carbohydrate kinase family protein [Candidatus Saccharimonadia bacterium]